MSCPIAPVGAEGNRLHGGTGTAENNPAAYSAKVAADDFAELGDTSTLADPGVVDDNETRQLGNEQYPDPCSSALSLCLSIMKTPISLFDFSKGQLTAISDKLPRSTDHGRDRCGQHFMVTMSGSSRPISQPDILFPGVSYFTGLRHFICLIDGKD